MTKNYYKNFYIKIIRPVLVKIYHKIPFIYVVRAILAQVRNRLFHRKNFKVLAELNNLIKEAKQTGQPIFIQFPIIPWNLWLFQRPQQFAIAMSKIGCLTIYVDAYNIKTPIKKMAENLYITNQYEILDNLSEAIVSIYFNYPPSVFDKYLTKEFFKQNYVFYEYVDHINEQIYRTYASTMRKRFVNIANQPVKLILATALVLYKELQKAFPDKKTLYLPNGVDISHYTNYKNLKSNIILPTKLNEAIKTKRKIIGFFGAIAPWIWDELILELANRRPEYCILLIGPVYGDRNNFPTKENIICTGSVNYQDLPYYANYFDVSIIPFKLGNIAKSTSPLKLFEYFAVGKPIVVTSDLVECTKFDGVLSGSTPGEFIDKIDVAISMGNDIELKQKYQKYAEENSWKARAEELMKVVQNTKPKKKVIRSLR